MNAVLALQWLLSVFCTTVLSINQINNYVYKITSPKLAIMSMVEKPWVWISPFYSGIDGTAEATLVVAVSKVKLKSEGPPVSL